MKTIELQHAVVKQFIVTFMIILFAAGGYFYLESYGADLEAQKIQVERETMALNSRIANFQRQQHEYEEAQKLWYTLSDTQKKRSGIILANAQQLLTNLKDQYTLGGFKADISKPEILRDVYSTETTAVVSTRVDLAFNALSDESVFSFVAALTRGLPGYVKIDSFQVAREGNIDPLLIKDLRRGKFHPIVQGRMTFFWRDLKDLTVTESPLEEEG